MGSLLNIHSISNGESPFVTIHDNDAVSPAFKGSSPKEKVPICGATEKIVKICMRKYIVQKLIKKQNYKAFLKEIRINGHLFKY